MDRVPLDGVVRPEGMTMAADLRKSYHAPFGWACVPNKVSAVPPRERAKRMRMRYLDFASDVPSSGQEGLATTVARTRLP